MQKRLGRVHLHAYAEETAFVGAFGFDANGSATLFNDHLDDGQAEADPVIVYACGALQFAELAEQPGQVLVLDSDPRVLHVHDEQVFWLRPVARFDVNLSVVGEL